MSDRIKHQLIRVRQGEAIKINPVLKPDGYTDGYFESLDSFPFHVVGIGRGVVDIERQISETPQPPLFGYVRKRPDLSPEYSLFLTNPTITSSELISMADDPEDLYPVFIIVGLHDLAVTRAKDVRVRLVYGDITAEAMNNELEPLYRTGYITDLDLRMWKDSKDGKAKYAYMPADPSKFENLAIYIDRPKPSTLGRVTVPPSRVLRFPIERVRG